jgi:hypothetical protein
VPGKLLLVVADPAVLISDPRVEGDLLQRLLCPRARPPIGKLFYRSFGAFCVLVAIAMVHADNRRACAITLTLFATGVALSALLIAAYSRPFTGEIL